jgi:hypothetical protein
MKPRHFGDITEICAAALALAEEIGADEAKFVLHVSRTRKDVRVYLADKEEEIRTKDGEKYLKKA